MFVVLKDIVEEEFGQILNSTNTLVIGDTWDDEAAAKNCDITFKNGKIIHECL